VDDPWNPTVADIRRWAADPNSLCPQDWDLSITGLGHEELFVELVEDEKCPKADFFLHCLYLWIYDLVRTGRADELEALLKRGEASEEQALRTWAKRSRALIANPKLAAKALWWGFGQKRGQRGHT